MSHAQIQFVAPVGDLYIVASEFGLEGIYRKKQKCPLSTAATVSAKTRKILEQTTQQLREYFQGQRKKFDLPLNPKGTTFQKKVWGELSRIPYASTCSYKDIATRIKNEKAVRAVGGANGKNPLWIIIPCHRVIAADGKLGGYSGGLSTKKTLLELERTHN